MALNSASPANFTTGVIVADTTSSAHGSPDAITAKLTPGAALDVQSVSGAFKPNYMTTDQRLSLPLTNGLMVYDTDLNRFMGVEEGVWGTVFDGADPLAYYVLKKPNAFLPNSEDLSQLTDGSLLKINISDIAGAEINSALPGTDYFAPTSFFKGKVTTNDQAVYNVASDDFLIAQTDTSVPISIVLPAVDGTTVGIHYIIKDQSGNASNNNITITATGGLNIDGSNHYTIDGNYNFVHLYNDGIQWYTLVLV